MCGIVGWIDWEKNLLTQKQVLKKMTQTLSARGPDAEGYWDSPEVSFGHRRLIVVDPSGGTQPMVRSKGEHSYVLIYNGELYNTPELRRELAGRGYHFEGHSDTEVLLLSYLEWGPSCVERLNGIFAFGIWDSYEKQLFVARDRLGVKPLFYTEQASSLLFASELKALLAHPDIKPVIDTQGLSELFLIGPARTPGHGIYCDIKELRAGYYLLYSAQGLKVQPYWTLPNHTHNDDFATTVAKVRDLFLDAVKRQMVSDVPLGTLLSGGLDSSAITAIAAGSQLLNGLGSLDTFSVDYVDNEKYFRPNSFQPNADNPWIKRVSDFFETRHHYITFDTPELVDALLPATWARDLPGMADVDSSLLLFAREIKKDITVGLSGECADEIFGGYPWFHRPETLQATTFPWAMNLENRLQILSPELRNKLKPEEYIAARYSEALAEIPKREDLRTKHEQSLNTDQDKLETRIREISYLTLTRFMPTLLDRKDRMTMAAGLEVRVPFCDHRLVEYVWNIPWDMRAYEGREKGLLRKALEGMLPEDVLWRLKSPYPKTHNPSYLKTVRSMLSDIIENHDSPLLPLIDIGTIKELIKISDTLPSGRPWFGQLMDTPQLFAYLIQINYWLKENKVIIN
ncbi:MAG: asparagine synthase (glutamine-hydrolyzing) [Desulfitobacteriaceae bacterium]